MDYYLLTIYNQFDPQDPFATIWGERRLPIKTKLPEAVSASAGGLNKTSRLTSPVLIPDTKC
jgi:hypothetical protein